MRIWIPQSEKRRGLKRTKNPCKDILRTGDKETRRSKMKKLNVDNIMEHVRASMIRDGAIICLLRESLNQRCVNKYRPN